MLSKRYSGVLTILVSVARASAIRPAAASTEIPSSFISICRSCHSRLRWSRPTPRGTPRSSHSFLVRMLVDAYECPHLLWAQGEIKRYRREREAESRRLGESVEKGQL